MGLTDQPDLQLPLSFLFLGMYTITVMGNLGLIILVQLNSHLHTPMYLFLFNFSFIDLCYSSVFTSKMLINFTSKKKIICYMGCMTQLYFFCFLVISEIYVLTSMAYGLTVASVMHFCITLLCPLKCVLALCLVPTWWHFLVPWLTLDACWYWPSVMQTPSTIISVMSTLCFSSPAQVPTSMSWLLSLLRASTSLCPVSPSVSLMVSFSPASSTSAPRRAGPKPLAPEIPTSLLFLSSLDHVHLCILNHLQLHFWMNKTSLLSFTPMWLLWWTP